MRDIDYDDANNNANDNNDNDAADENLSSFPFTY
jgi:hypothetical protein